jgi:hypothetical protein
MKIKTATGFWSSPWLQASKIVLERSGSRRTPRRHNEATDIGSFTYSHVCDEDVVVHLGRTPFKKFALLSGAESTTCSKRVSRGYVNAG